ncbi:hypothetical protein C8R41DRAFT_138734 [Lentinula lateritia]|uniref:Uncharacterized protein n=1 Tax=Lentinula lateritia TaxID=40482 RepID=A0ABQ8VSU5_9AGAR|nr:hypothetical protein C8R41DRAFT_138734 [Lentinula lateritia]
MSAAYSSTLILILTFFLGVISFPMTLPSHDNQLEARMPPVASARLNNLHLRLMRSSVSSSGEILMIGGTNSKNTKQTDPDKRNASELMIFKPRLTGRRPKRKQSTLPNSRPLNSTLLRIFCTDVSPFYSRIACFTLQMKKMKRRKPSWQLFQNGIDSIKQCYKWKVLDEAAAAAL